MLTLNTSPVTPYNQFSSEARAPTLIEDVTYNGAMLISYLGNKHAVGFTGTTDFIKRCFNLFHNRGIIGLKAQLHCAYDRGVRICYVVVPSKERLHAGLAEQFRSEIIEAREVLPLAESYDSETGAYDVTFDEEKIGELAARRAEAFIVEHIPQSNFMGRREADETLAPIYAEVDRYRAMSSSRGGESDE